MRNDAQIFEMSGRRFGPHLSRMRTRIGALGDRVGMIPLSEGDVQGALNTFVSNNSTRHDTSVASWKEVWVTRGNPDRVDDNGIPIMTKADIYAICTDAGMESVCNKVVDGLLAKFDGADGTAKDNRISWAEFLAGSGLHDPTLPGPPPSPDAGPPPDTEVISDSDRNSAALTDAQIEDMCAPLVGLSGGVTVDTCRLTAQGSRSDAQAKIARITAAPPPAPGGTKSGVVQQKTSPPVWVAPKPTGLGSTAAALGAVPVGLGGLAALKFGVTALVVGGVLGVVVAGGAYAYLRATK